MKAVYKGEVKASVGGTYSRHEIPWFDSMVCTVSSRASRNDSPNEGGSREQEKPLVLTTWEGVLREALKREGEYGELWEGR